MVKYGKTCSIDRDCSSNVCEMTYTDAGQPIGRKCIIQAPKYGKKCTYNKDCVSNRCIKTFDENDRFLGYRCAVVDGMPVPKRGWPFDDAGMPDILRSSKRHQAVRNDESMTIVSNAEKARAFQGRGPVSEFILLVMELFLNVIRIIVDTLYMIWKTVFNIVYDFTFGAIQFHKIFGWWKKYTCIDITYFRYIVTFLFPPMGVFMKKGINGFGYILLCCILTMLFYFPGLIYAIIIMTEGEIKCPLSKKRAGDQSKKSSVSSNSISNAGSSVKSNVLNKKQKLMSNFT